MWNYSLISTVTHLIPLMILNTITQNRLLFYHWALYKDKVEDIEDYMKYGVGNQLDFFIHLLRSNPCMYMSNTKFTQAQTWNFTFNDGPNNMLNLKSTSSILCGKDHLSSSLSQASFSSSMSTTVKEKRQRSLHHGAYQHILNKENNALSRSECNGVAYVWVQTLMDNLALLIFQIWSLMKWIIILNDFTREFELVARIILWRKFDEGMNILLLSQLKEIFLYGKITQINNLALAIIVPRLLVYQRESIISRML